MKKKCLFLLFILIIIPISAEWTIVQTYSIPEGASGLAFDGTYLYCGIYGANGDEVYQIDPSDGTYQLQFSNANIGDSFGMTWDGTNLWITDHVTSPSIPATAIELDINSGTILSQFDLPAHYMSGIAYDSGDFWVTAYYDPDGEIYKVDNTGAIIQQFAAPDAQPWDLCLENDNLWMADYWGDALYKIDPITGTLLETHPSEGTDPAGIVFDGQYLWYCDNGSGGFDYLYKVDLGGVGTPAIELGWDDYNFGNTTIGQPESVELPVTNIGTADLMITNLDFTLNDFSSDETLPITITPSSTENLTIIFDPSVWGAYSCILTVESNDPVNPFELVTLSGYAVTDDPQIVISPTNLNYGSIRVDALTGRYLNISNQGSGNLEITQFEFDDTQYILDETVELPLIITPASEVDVRIWFNPQSSGTINATCTIYSNDPTALTTDIALTGTGDNTQYAIGSILWQYTINTGYDNSPKAITPIEDINGDEVGDVIICSEDNFVRCFNGNASVTGDVLWETEIYSGNIYNQNALKIIEDIDSDEYDDVIVGTTGGDRAVRAISGKTGQLIWTFNTSIYGGDGGWVYQVDVSYDYNNDGIQDVLAATGSDAQRVMCLDGTTGSELWNFYLAGPKFSCIGISDINNDGVPDAIGGGSNSYETEGKIWGISGANGSQLWEFTTGGSSVWALAEVDDFSGNGINDVVVGDFGGNYYGIDTSNGSMEWSGSIGSGLIIRFEKLNDVNGNGHPDIAIARSTQDNAIVIDGHTGDNIWLQPVADQPWVVDKIGDITGDGINDVVWGTLFGSNFGYFMDGATGNILSQTPVGSACDAIGGIPDVAGDGSWEMIMGGRNGAVICVSGGETVGNGILEGTITLNGGTGSVNATSVQIGTTTVTVDPTGYYTTELIPGLYDVTFSLPTYESVTIENVEVISEQITTLDVVLNYCFAPQNLTYTIEYNDIILEWDEPQTTREVTSYKVYRDEVEIAEINELTYTDEDLIIAIYEYYVTAIYSDGQESESSNVVTIELTSSGNGLIPLVTKLHGNYPNPFNPSTSIRFDLAGDSDVTIQIFNVKGQLIKTLIQEKISAGEHSIEWNGDDDDDRSIASGIYLYKLQADLQLFIRKCILLK
ncbi:MAG: choice-of-anchor D domain-containing protein [Candidatus Tenebribacter burtonii]|nr:choice-of-anchor D domain-containing protein [Candidatus Tenebribacter burtonii]